MDDEAQALVEIRNLLAACTQAGDARKADAYAESFALHGVLHLETKIEGREAIRSWMTAPSVIPQPTSPSPGFVSHHLTTSHIEITSPQTAKGKTYWLVITAAGLDHSGYYNDLFIRQDGKWLIEYRKPRTLWVSRDSLIVK